MFFGMPDDISAELRARAQAIDRGLRPLRFLIGCWRGEGSDHGAPLSSSLDVALILDGSFVEAREVTRDATGHVTHEDRAIYRYDVEDGRLKVTHLVPGGWFLERVVRPIEGGVIWQGGPLAAAVEFRQVPGGLETAVRFPGCLEPDVVVRYVPA